MYFFSYVLNSHNILINISIAYKFWLFHICEEQSYLGREWIIPCPNSIVCSEFFDCFGTFVFFTYIIKSITFYLHFTVLPGVGSNLCQLEIKHKLHAQLCSRSVDGLRKAVWGTIAFVQHPLFAEHYFTVMYSMCSLLRVWSRELGAPGSGLSLLTANLY